MNDTESTSNLSAESAPRRVPAVLFGATILLSAFLLFQVQPLIAKLILPWFGGSAAVWTSCMLFFQVALLAGYGYAHWLNEQKPERQTTVHIGLLAVSLLSLPIIPREFFKPTGVSDPLLGILALLTATVGLPYFLLSSTSPLLQSWYSRSNGGAMPYRFFALSNFGSMLGLLAYPVLVEPYLPNRTQAWMWSVGYVLFMVVCITVAFLSRHARRESHEAVQTDRGPAPTMGQRLIWMGLAACASGLLLAVTNHLTQNVAAIPFLWVLPLSLYLLSFILCFDSDRWYDRWLFTGLGAIALPGMAYSIADQGNISDLRLAVEVFCAALFVMFMVCHGELARRRPAPGYLTSFYLMVSVGGAVGGLFIGFVAPYLFNALYDLPVVLSATAILLVSLLWQKHQAKPDGETHPSPETSVTFPAIVLGAICAAICANLYSWKGAALGFAGGAAFVLIVIWMRGQLSRALFDDSFLKLASIAAATGLAFGITGFLARDVYRNNRNTRVLVRNFYGALAVYDSDSSGSMGPVRTLRHGTIDHGEQFLWPQNARFPTTYYSKGSGIGRAIQTLQPDGPMTVGVIGLGTGTIASYGRPIDHYVIYDINPLVYDLAKTQFTFLLYCLAPHDVVMGDARLSLENELKAGNTREFDVLAVDAFSGDSIPVHLLTREAFRLYWQHLKPDGVLAVHVSNKFLRLAPVVALAAEADGKTAKVVTTDENEDTAESASDWVLVSSRPGFFEQPTILGYAAKIEPIKDLRIWTDDYSNLYRILR